MEQLRMATSEKYARLVPDTPDASGCTNTDIASYVGLETEGRPDACSGEDVKFIRSASFNGYDVWIWSCKTSDEGNVYVHAAHYRAGSSICLTTRWQSVDTMSPEEYLEWDYAIQEWPRTAPRK
jgi:hypothetical protein